MKIINKTKNIVLSENCEMADSFLKRLLGLMFSGKFRDILIKAKRESVEYASIHMMFMNYPIDVVWINSSHVVVDVAGSIPPLSLADRKTWRLYKPKKRAQYVLEISVKRPAETEVGDEIEFKD